VLVTDQSRVVYRHFIRDSTRWDGFVFRPDDIVISTPSKCGTTWLQMICALLVFQSPALPEPLSRLSPWLDMVTRPLGDVLADLEAQQHRRFIKTHTPLDGVPWDPRVTYIGIGRDPRDVAVSFDNHRAIQDRDALVRARASVLGDGADDPFRQMPRLPTPRERFWFWVDDATPPSQSVSTLWMTLHHLNTYWQVRDKSNVILLHYRELLADLDGQMRALARKLAIAVPENDWPELVSAATLEQMRARADALAPNVELGIWRDNARFFHRGGSGNWRDFLDEADMARYHRRVAELAGPDLAAWVHNDSQ
jgi:aryl sulfotransferase